MAQIALDAEVGIEVEHGRDQASPGLVTGRLSGGYLSKISFVRSLESDGLAAVLYLLARQSGNREITV